MFTKNILLYQFGLKFLSYPSFPRRACPREGVGRESTKILSFNGWRYFNVSFIFIKEINKNFKKEVSYS